MACQTWLPRPLLPCGGCRCVSMSPWVEDGRGWAHPFRIDSCGLTVIGRIRYKNSLSSPTSILSLALSLFTACCLVAAQRVVSVARFADCAPPPWVSCKSCFPAHSCLQSHPCATAALCVFCVVRCCCFTFLYEKEREKREKGGRKCAVVVVVVVVVL